MFRVIYMGYSAPMIQYLIDSDLFNLERIISVKNRTTPEQNKLIQKHHLPFLELNSPENLNSHKLFSNCDLIIIYKFEYIIPQQLIDHNQIINFHGGNLRSNRGAHATVRSILNMDNKTCLSMYQLTGGIDQGLLIGEYNVPISDTDDTISLNRKLAQGIPSLLSELNEYLSGRKTGELVINGTYYPKICEQDYTINLNTDNIKVICAKIRSQKAYQGAIIMIGEKKFRIKQYEILPIETKLFAKTIQNNQLIIHEGQQQLICELLEKT